jgi:glycosyltransferase involved in cell wall biosynthesis
LLELTPKLFADLSVLGLLADQAACGYYRIEFPFEYLRRLGARVDTSGACTMELLADYDLIVVQRNYDPLLLGMLREAQRAPFNKVLLYEVDDYLHDVHPQSPAYRTFRPGGENLHNVDRYLRTVDGLLVSTPELAGEYSAKTKRTWVLPNGIDFGIRDWNDPAPRDLRLLGKTVIGWAGSSFHPDDMLPLVGSLKRVLQTHPQAVFAICSGPQQVQQFLSALDLPVEQVVVLDPVPFWEYPQLISQFDICLAPLSNSRFNRSKSALKILESGAWGTPYVASRIAPYNRVHLETEGQGGRLASRPQEWEAHLTELLQNPQARIAAGEFMHTATRERYNLGLMMNEWASALRQARDAAHHQPLAEIKHAPVAARRPGRNDACPCGSGGKYKKCCYPSWG